jgi:predicted metal-dependent hydrolase
MTLTVRYPKIDYSKVPAHWARNIAFAQDRNSASLLPTPVEPWLIKVLQSVIDKLPEGDPKLREDVLGFIGQESQHYRQHNLFNKAMIAQGYPRLPEFERALADELAAFLKTRSPKFLFAYADGFESLGAVSGGIWFEKSDGMLAGADPSAVALWKWHIAEEFEHREICFKVYHALFGRGLWNAVVNGYFYRVYGFIFAILHLKGHSSRIFEYLLETDRQTMTEAEKQKLEADLKEFAAFQRKHFLTQLLKNFLPWYNPGRKRMPRGLMDYLKQFEAGGGYARAAAEPAQG